MGVQALGQALHHLLDHGRQALALALILVRRGLVGGQGAGARDPIDLVGQLGAARVLGLQGAQQGLQRRQARGDLA